jgi:hypothetical protein
LGKCKPCQSGFDLQLQNYQSANPAKFRLALASLRSTRAALNMTLVEVVVSFLRRFACATRRPPAVRKLIARHLPRPYPSARKRASERPGLTHFGPPALLYGKVQSSDSPGMLCHFKYGKVQSYDAPGHALPFHVGTAGQILIVTAVGADLAVLCASALIRGGIFI